MVVYCGQGRITKRRMWLLELLQASSMSDTNKQLSLAREPRAVEEVQKICREVLPIDR